MFNTVSIKFYLLTKCCPFSLSLINYGRRDKVDKQKDNALVNKESYSVRHVQLLRSVSEYSDCRRAKLKKRDALVEIHSDATKFTLQGQSVTTLAVHVSFGPSCMH